MSAPVVEGETEVQPNNGQATVHLSASEWRAQGSCKEIEDPEIFFPLSQNIASAKAAKRVCSGCPVQYWCFREAMAAGPNLEGIWGGTTDLERRHLFRIRGVIK